MTEGEIYVLDTHVLIWYFVGSKRLQQRLKERIDEVRNQGGRLLVPTIVLAEALDIAEKGKVKFDFTKMNQFICTEPEFEVISFTLEILEEAIRVKEIKEIHDRIIVASARFYQAGIMSKDRVIHESGEVEVL